MSVMFVGTVEVVNVVDVAKITRLIRRIAVVKAVRICSIARPPPGSRGCTKIEAYLTFC